MRRYFLSMFALHFDDIYSTICHHNLQMGAMLSGSNREGFIPFWCARESLEESLPNPMYEKGIGTNLAILKSFGFYPIHSIFRQPPISLFKPMKFHCFGCILGIIGHQHIKIRDVLRMSVTVNVIFPLVKTYAYPCVTSISTLLGTPYPLKCSSTVFEKISIFPLGVLRCVSTV